MPFNGSDWMLHYHLTRLTTLGPRNAASLNRHHLPLYATDGTLSSVSATASESITLQDMADQAEEPLIGNRNEDYRDPDEAARSDEFNFRHDPALLLQGSLQTPSLFVWLLTFSAGISGLLFGYDTGVISATLVSVGSSLSNRPLTTLDKSLITACTSLFALIVSPASGLLADGVGRKKIILLADVLFVLGAAVQAVATSVWLMIVGRSIVGLAVGAASFVVPLYIAELAPARFRGRLVTLNVLFITLGQVVAYLIGWRFAESEGADGWRWMVGLGALPAGFQCLVMVMMPESPRWLVKVGRVQEAKIVLAKVFGAGSEIQKLMQVILKGIEHEVREEEEEGAKRSRMRGKAWFPTLNDSWSRLFHVPGNRRALAIACLLQGLQQLCGFNSLMYFSATIFSLIGFSSPTLTSLSVATTNFAFTLLSLLLIDLLGRRRILLASIPVMALALAGCGVAFRSIITTLPADANAPNPAATPDADAVAQVPVSARSAPLFVLVSLVLYVAAYALGLGNVPWQQSELFPLNVRSLGASLATATNWGSNFIVGLTFLPMMDLLSPSWTFVVYAVVCLVGWLLIYSVYPETRGLSLEETGELLKDGWGVERSLRRRRTDHERCANTTRT